LDADDAGAFVARLPDIAEAVRNTVAPNRGCAMILLDQVEVSV
jgi:hypothetical protein